MTRPFHFLADARQPASAPVLAERARRAESIGFHALVVPDHLIDQLSPVPALAVIAAATERLRIAGFSYPITITDKGHVEARRAAAVLRRRSGVELTESEVLASPHLYVGSVDSLVEKIVALREELGVSSFLVGEMDEMLPVVERLAGS